MIDWKKIRDDFPVTRNKVYFMSAGLSPIPTPVLNSICSEHRVLNEFGDANWSEDLRIIGAIRDRIGRYIGCTGSDLTFLNNTSANMGIVALSMKSALKDFNVVSMTDEFPSSTVPFEYAGIKMRYVSPVDARYSVDSILEKVDEKTAAVVTSYVQYSTGFRQNLWTLGDELKKRGVMLIVNATQAFPFYQLDLKGMNISAMSASLHKWGFAGHMGALFYTSPEFRQKFPPPFAGWLSLKTDDGFIHTKKNAPLKLLDSAERYTCGSSNLQAIKSFGTAFDYLSNIGFDNIRARIVELTDHLISKLRDLDLEIISPVARGEERSPIVTFDARGRGNECVEYLDKIDICTSFRAGNVRISVNFFNDHEDIDKLADALSRFLKV